MTMSVLLAALAVGVSVPILLFSVGSARATTARVGRNLAVDRPVTNLRQIVLSRSAADRALRPLGYAIATRARRLTPSGVLDAMERRLDLAGDARSVEVLLLTKVASAAAFGGAGLWLMVRSPSPATTILALIGLVGGYIAPDALLARRADHRQLLIEHELPDMLDQLSICVEAGLGFDAALHRVARTGRGPMAQELARSLQDLRLGMPRHDALRAMAERTGVSSLRSFVHAVIQAETYGVPTAQVLRTQAIEHRERRRFRAEERAMKIPVKLVFPLVLCILPSLLLVVLGPGLIQIFRHF